MMQTTHINVKHKKIVNHQQLTCETRLLLKKNYYYCIQLSHTHTHTHRNTKLFKWKENSTVIVKKYRVYKQN